MNTCNPLRIKIDRIKSDRMKNVTDPKVSFNSVNAESDLHLSNTAKNSAKFITKHKNTMRTATEYSTFKTILTCRRKSPPSPV